MWRAECFARAGRRGRRASGTTKARLTQIVLTDFFMPMVDDQFDFGRIAATNALSDIYAMGGRPIFALAILGMPIERMPTAIIREILRGGSAIAADAGHPYRGGPFHRLARAGVRPRCDRAHVAGRAQAQQRGAHRRRPHIDEAPRRRRLLGRDQERRAAARARLGPGPPRAKSNEPSYRWKDRSETRITLDRIDFAPSGRSWR